MVIIAFTKVNESVYVIKSYLSLHMTLNYKSSFENTYDLVHQFHFKS